MSSGGAFLQLGFEGFQFRDLFDPTGLERLSARFDSWLEDRDSDAHALYAELMRNDAATPQIASERLVRLGPAVASFVAELFGVADEVAALRVAVESRQALWSFRAGFVKTRLKSPPSLADVEAQVGCPPSVLCQRVVAVLAPPDADKGDEELTLARLLGRLHELEGIHRKAERAGGASWTEEEESLAKQVLDAAMAAGASVGESAPGALGPVLDAFAAWLGVRRARDPGVSAWRSLHTHEPIDPARLVRHEKAERDGVTDWLAPLGGRHRRDGFGLTGERASARGAEEAIDTCVFCHARDKDSCSKGYRDAKSGGLRKNALGVTLAGCPLGEKISEAHLLRRQGEVLGALVLITIDNPMCAGTGHRICNDCVKACIFQKQEPVDIPQVESRILWEVLNLRWGVEIYGLLARWNPLRRQRPHPRPATGRRALVVGLGPAGYTLTHHLASEGVSVLAVDGLKIEPLAPRLSGLGTFEPIERFESLCEPLDERRVSGFGGVAEYGITPRWDKNFLTLIHLTVARHPLVRTVGGCRFGGAIDFDGAWEQGFDHVALATGAGFPTTIGIDGNLAAGFRQASDFLMALQLRGAFKHAAIAPLTMDVPAIVIGGGLTAVDTATELSAYYPVFVERTARRYDALVSVLGEEALRARFSERDLRSLDRHVMHGREVIAERDAAARERREPRLVELVDGWGGVRLVYRKPLEASPAYRLNHEEIIHSLAEGVRFSDGLSPIGAVLDKDGRVEAMRFSRRAGDDIELPARTVCVAAGTRPNISVLGDSPSAFVLDAGGWAPIAHTATARDGRVDLARAETSEDAFFTSLVHEHRTVSFLGDAHPAHAGNVVRAMASAARCAERVARVFDELETSTAGRDATGEARWLDALVADLEGRLVRVERIGQSIVQAVVRAPAVAKAMRAGMLVRLDNHESTAPRAGDTPLLLGGYTAYPAWIDEARGEIGLVVDAGSRAGRVLERVGEGERAVIAGPTGAPIDVGGANRPILVGRGADAAGMLPIARAFRDAGASVRVIVELASAADRYLCDRFEAEAGAIVWATRAGTPAGARRESDVAWAGSAGDAMRALARGELEWPAGDPAPADALFVLGSLEFVESVRDARKSANGALFTRDHRAIVSLRAPMQCAMKGICARCLVRVGGAGPGGTRLAYACAEPHQPLDEVDFVHLAGRLATDAAEERLSTLWVEHSLGVLATERR